MISFNAVNFGFGKITSPVLRHIECRTNSAEIQKDVFARSCTFSLNPEFENFTENISLFNTISKKEEPCLLINTATENGGCLRILKNVPALLNCLQKFFQQEKTLYEQYKSNYFTFTQPLLNEINKKSPQAFNAVKELFIGEIAYSKLSHKSELDKLEKLKYKKISEQKDIICVQNFIVYKKEYKNAYRCMVISLFKNILKNNPNIIIKAQAFGENPKSPINLYLRYGFIPLDTDIEKLNQTKIKTDKGIRINPKETAIMFLPEDAILYRLLAKV